MKKFIIIIIVFCILIGVPLGAMAYLSSQNGSSNIPNDYTKKLTINLGSKTRDNAVVYSFTIDKPMIVDLFMQNDSTGYKGFKVVGEGNLIGLNPDTPYLWDDTSELQNNNNFTRSLYLDKGKYNIVVTNDKSNGNMYIGYKERPLSSGDFKRIKAISSGDINNPPSGYEQVFATKLTDLNDSEKNVYSFTLDKSEYIGLSIYSNSKKGFFKVDLNGKETSCGSVASSDYFICDQRIQYLSKGKYEFDLTSQDADRELYIFIKR